MNVPRFLALILVAFVLYTSAHAESFTSYLVRGSQGPEVTQLQELLRKEGYFTFPSVTGYYGPITESAVQAFQNANGIPSVGVVGPITRGKLNTLLDQSVATTSTPVIDSVKQDLPRRRAVRHGGGNSNDEEVAPSDISLSVSTVPEDTATSATIATISAVADNSVTFSIVSDPDSKFSVSGTSLVLAAALDFEASTTHAVTLRATDATNGLTYDETFTITVTDVSEIPAWLPQAPSGDYPLAYADFENGRYWIDDAEVTAGDVLVDTGRITPGTGYVQEDTDTGVRFEDGFISSFIAGDWTAVSEWIVAADQEVTSHSPFSVTYADDSIDFAAFVDSSLTPPNVSVYKTAGGFGGTNTINAPFGSMKGSFSRRDNSMVLSVNGSANESAAKSVIVADPDKVILGSYDAVSTGVSDFSVQTFMVYGVQDNTDLSDLSTQ